MGTTNRTKQHHYLPVCYLKGFSMSGQEDCQLHALDLRSLHSWTQTPRNLAREGGFYAIDVEGQDANAIETALSNVETHFGIMLQEIGETQALPTAEHFDWFLNFVAVQAARVPHIRRLGARMVDHFAKQQMREHIDSFHGSDEVRRFILGEDYTVSVGQTWHVGIMLDLVDRYLPALAKRNWSLGIAADDAPDLICSDTPVSQMPFSGVDFDPKTFNIETPNTLISVPLTRRLVAFGTYEMPATVHPVNRRGIARFNTITIQMANYLFSAETNFHYLDSLNVVRERADLLQYLAARVAHVCRGVEGKSK